MIGVSPTQIGQVGGGVCVCVCLFVHKVNLGPYVLPYFHGDTSNMHAPNNVILK